MAAPYVGARDPESLALTITDDDFDFTTVESVEIEVLHPQGGRRSTWEWDLDTGTLHEITLTHLFADDGSDVPRAGDYRLSGWLVTADSRRRIEPVSVRFAPYPV